MASVVQVSVNARKGPVAESNFCVQETGVCHPQRLEDMFTDEILPFKTTVIPMFCDVSSQSIHPVVVFETGAPSTGQRWYGLQVLNISIHKKHRRYSKYANVAK